MASDLVTIEGGRWVKADSLPEQRRFKEKCREDWYREYPKGDDWLAELKLSRDAMRVLLCMRGSLRYENIVGRSQAEVGRRLSMCPANVSRAVALLVEKGVLDVVLKQGRQKQYRMSHFVGWRGSMKSEREFLAGYAAPVPREDESC
jgi:hypothetical protein